MIDEIRAITSFAKGRCLHIDGLLFRLHCRLTTILILVALFIVSTSQFIGNPIYCDNEALKISKEMLNAFCYIYSTYTMDYNDTVRHAVYPGVGPEFGHRRRVKYEYYQWIWVIYFLQALSFYLPNWIWKMLEGGRLKALVKDVEVMDVSCQMNKCDRIIGMGNYLSRTFGSNNSYMLYYIMCEMGIMANLFLQVFFLNFVFDGKYLTYGLNAIYYWGSDCSPMMTVFPKMTKCEYKRFGPSGEVDIMDSLCMLPLNNFNDKFFFLMWFWMLIMVILFIIVFMYRIIQITSVSIRCFCLRKMINKKDLALMPQEVHMMMYNVSLGDWFLLLMIGSNVDSIIFYHVLCEITEYHQNRCLRDIEFKESLIKLNRD